MEITNQKEYLKKYLSGSLQEGKKKKKRKPIVKDRVTIIDDDIDISQLQTAEEAIDLFHTNEDAPQVVGVIDERPMHLRVKDYRDSNLWKPVGEQIDIAVLENDVLKTSFQIKNKKSESLLQFKQLSVLKNKKSRLGNTMEHNSVSKHNYNDSLQKSSEGNLSDQSPPRRGQKADDSSPPRRKLKDVDDSSPLRFKAKDTTDSSPPRRQLKIADDSSPRRRPPKDKSPLRKTQKSTSFSSPRRSLKHSDSNRQRINSERNSSRNPTSKSHSNSPLPPTDQDDLNPHRRKQQPEIQEAKRKILPGDKRGKYLIPAKRNEKMTKTLEGKTAGLQNAQELIKENQEFRKREDSLFKNLDAEISGINAATIVRDRKTGRIRDFAKEAEERKEKEKREEETKEKYMQWGKGLKQVEDYQDRLAQDLHEMNKPLARYADDEDLERYLKERERDEDPMLQYIRRKKKKKDVEIGKPTKLEYMGEFMPNRYGIVPGHRWDGVDRSNGYEQRWLETQNAKLALQEDIYIWSTEDM